MSTLIRRIRDTRNRGSRPRRRKRVAHAWLAQRAIRREQIGSLT